MLLQTALERYSHVEAIAVSNAGVSSPRRRNNGSRGVFDEGPSRLTQFH